MSAQQNLVTPAVSPLEMAIESTVKNLFATGRVQFDVPDEAVVQIVATKFPKLATLDADFQAVAETLTKRKKAQSIDRAAVAQIADEIFQNAYAAAAKAHAVNGTAEPLPPLLPVDRNFVWGGQCDEIKTFVELGYDIMLSGPSGSCKTYPAENVLRTMGRRYEIVGVFEGMNDRHFVCAPKVEVVNGASQTAWEYGPLVKAMRGGYVLIVDEVDNTPMENLACFRTAMASRTLFIPQTGERIVAAAGFMVIMTCNGLRDTTGGYSGYPIDHALKSRLTFVKCDYLNAADEIAILEKGGLAEADAKAIVRIFKALRALYRNGKMGMAPSTRAAWAIAMLMQAKDKDGNPVAGVAPKSFADAIAAVLVNSLPENEAAEVAAVLKQGL